MRTQPLTKAAVRAFSRVHAAVYRALRGRGPGNRNTLILATKGRRSGREVRTPLLYVESGGKLYVVASFGGSDEPPGWYRNLQKMPEAGVEVGASRGRYRARTLSTDEAASIWPRLLAMYPTYASYQKRTTRLIPVVELTPA